MPPSSVGICLLADALLAWWLLRRGELTLARLVFAVACGLVLVVAQGALALLFGRGFLAVRLGHAWLFLFLPVACAAVLLAARRRAATRAARAAAWSGLLVLPALFAWTGCIEPNDLVLETAEVVLPAGRSLSVPLRIGVLADLQCAEVGEHEREAVELLVAQRPDLILIPGDLFQTSSRDELEALGGPLREILGRLHAPLGVFAVPGHCDPVDRLLPMLEGTQVRLLRDESLRLVWGGRTIALCGLNPWVWSRSARRQLEALERAGEDVRLVFSHVPDAALQLPGTTRVDLVVAGHTHGGQVRLPFFGPLITLSHVPREVAGGGLHAIGGTRIYVSRGVGAERGEAPLLRFNCPPEISLITLR
jgi:predicted MPP superfamily phosphohydrolase